VSHAAGAPGAADPDAVTPMEWSFNPWREQPARAWFAAASKLLLCLAVASVGIPLVVTLGLCLATMGAVSPAFSPSRCRLDDAGAGRRGPFGWDRRRWDEIRRAAAGRRVLVLSPYTRPHWLDAWRALVLPIPLRDAAPDRDLLLHVLRRHGLA
jgi:hypothetical protein